MTAVSFSLSGLMPLLSDPPFPRAGGRIDRRSRGSSLWRSSSCSSRRSDRGSVVGGRHFFFLLQVRHLAGVGAAPAVDVGDLGLVVVSVGVLPTSLLLMFDAGDVPDPSVRAGIGSAAAADFTSFLPQVRSVIGGVVPIWET